MTTLERYFDSLEFKTPEAMKVWKQIKDIKSFDSSSSFFSRASFCDSLPLGRFPLDQQKSYLPIEWLKGDQKPFVSKNLLCHPEKTFLSSGTTQKTRSQSHFSHDGFLLFKAQSVKIFYDLLSHFVSSEQILSFQGVSLVPSIEDWKTSSLAHMVHFFSEFWPLDYETLESFSRKETPKPLWIFGTALHFKELVDRGLHKPLPPGSLVIETGGLKSSKASFTREELYKGLQKIFSLSNEQIISEYSMCELATQAYDFKKESQGSRVYRFPSWVSVFSSLPLGEMVASGKGCLTLFDPLRVDYPFSIRVQDIVTLYSKGSFEFHGRVPNSVLKGCSLLAEDVLSERHSSSPRSHSSQSQSLQKKSLEQVVEKKVLLRLQSFLSEFFKKPVVQKKLLEEFCSCQLVEQSIEDLLEGFLKKPQTLLSLSQKSKSRGKSFLLILPNTHMFALFYPCLVAFLKGVKLSVRLPRAYPRGSVVDQFLFEFSKEFSYPVQVFSPEDRIPDEIETKNFDALMSFGSNETHQVLAPYLKCPSQFFGSTLSLSLLDDFEKESLRRLFRDAFSLGQMGCFSSRLVFCLVSLEDFLKQKEKIFKEIQRIFREEFSFQIPLEKSLALDHEFLHFKQKTSAFSQVFEPGSPLIFFHEVSEGLALEDLLSTSQFFLPIIFVDKRKALELCHKFHEKIRLSANPETLRALSKEKNLESVELLSLGSSNKTQWDGYHQGKLLFDL